MSEPQQALAPVTTTRFAPSVVTEFLQNATPGQRTWYLTRGEPQCLEGCIVTNEGMQPRYYPGLRGIAVGKAAPNPNAAIDEAAAVLARMLAKGGHEAFDEAEAGIDGEASDLAERFSSVGARLEAIHHIGAMMTDGMPEALTEIVAGLADGSASMLYDDIPFLWPLIDRTIAEGTEDDESALAEDFSLLAGDHGYLGFVVEVTVPEYVPTGSGSASIRMGCRHVEHRYGSTFKVACDRALAWAEEEIARMMRGESRPRSRLRRITRKNLDHSVATFIVDEEATFETYAALHDNPTAPNQRWHVAFFPSLSRGAIGFVGEGSTGHVQWVDGATPDEVLERHLADGSTQLELI